MADALVMAAHPLALRNGPGVLGHFKDLPKQTWSQAMPSVLKSLSPDLIMNRILIPHNLELQYRFNLSVGFN